MYKRLAAAFAALAILLSIAACAARPAAAPQEQSLYQRVGGRDAIVAVIDDSIANISTDTRINHRFTNDGTPLLKKNLVDLVCLRIGGPCTYTGRDMAAAHEGMYIRDDEFDALVEDMVKSLDKFKVPAREKAELLALLGQMRNSIVGH